MDMDIDYQVRIEALKMAYEVGFKTGELNDRQTPENRFKAFKEIIELAELNAKFIKGEALNLDVRT